MESTKDFDTLSQASSAAIDAIDIGGLREMKAYASPPQDIKWVLDQV